MLNPAVRRLVLINGLYTLANGLSGLFTSVYLWRLRPGVTTPAYYQLWTFLTIMIAMPTLGAYVKKRGAGMLNAIGMMLYAALYLMLLILQDRAAFYLPLIGITNGLALSCYALATHVLAYDLTDEVNREAYYNRNGLVNSLAGLVAPLLSGWLVSSLAGLSGYRVVFIISFVVFSAAAVLGLGLHSVRQSAPYRLFSVFPGTHKGWHRLLLGYTLMGMRDGLFGFAVNLLVFLATGGERSVGNFAFVTALVGMASFYVAGRVMNQQNRTRLFPVGAVLMALSTGVIALGASWKVMLVYGLLINLATPFWQTTWSTVGFEIIKQANPADQDMRIEMIGAREIPLNLGRMLSLFILLRFTPTDGSTGFLQVLLACLSLVFPATWLVVRKALHPAPAPAAVE